MENQAGQYTTEYEILDLLKLKLYQQLHGLAPVLGAVEFRIEEPKQPEPNGGVEQESADRACAGFRIDGRVFYLSPSRLRSDFLKDSASWGTLSRPGVWNRRSERSGSLAATKRPGR